MSLEVQLNELGVSVGASTIADISLPFNPPRHKELLLKIVLSQASQTTGVTFNVQDSYNNGQSYSNVGDQAQATLTKKTFVIGTAQEFTVTFPATAGAAQGDYLEFEVVGSGIFALWLNIDADGTVPSGAAYVASASQLQVDIATGDTATQVGAKVVAQLAPFWTDFFTMVDNEDGSVTITQVIQGEAAEPVPHNENDSGAGSISAVVDVEGEEGGLTLASNQVTITSHGFATGDLVCLAGTLPAPLVAGAYYVIKIDANNIQFATTHANAIAQNEIDLTAPGEGTCSVIGGEIEIRMIESDSSDLAQLPLWDSCKVIATTGLSDSITVSKIYVAE
jgi:hypothetical protein